MTDIYNIVYASIQYNSTSINAWRIRERKRKPEHPFSTTPIHITLPLYINPLNIIILSILSMLQRVVKKYTNMKVRCKCNETNQEQMKCRERIRNITVSPLTFRKMNGRKMLSHWNHWKLYRCTMRCKGALWLHRKTNIGEQAMTYTEVKQAYLNGHLELALATPKQIDKLCCEMKTDQPLEHYDMCQEELNYMIYQEFEQL